MNARQERLEREAVARRTAAIRARDANAKPAGHTPGPWVYEGREDLIRRRAVRSEQTRVLIAEGYFDPLLMDSDEAEANARLIAAATQQPHECDLPDCEGGKARKLWEAAPELAEALRGYLGAESEEWPDWDKKASAALQKAGLA
jgi:hypothetical protein